MLEFRRYRPYLPDILLLIFSVSVFCYVLSYYPLPQLTWDSFYYVKASIESDYGIRPLGYPVFLEMVYGISKSIHLVVWSQFVIYFASTLFFIKTIARIFKLPPFIYVLTGALLLLEPVSLYHANNILSDSIFGSFTLLAFSFLLMFLHTKKYVYALLHVALLVICIEVRYIALFYPFFSCIVISFWDIKPVAKWVTIIVILLTYSGLYKLHVDNNRKNYGVPVFSAFSGWTHANNALYALPRIKLDAKYIENPDIRDMHSFFTNYLDTSSFVVQKVGSGYLWEDMSPLNVMRRQLIDSTHVDYNASWYLLAERYHYYGLFIQKNFPYEYVMSYMVPNVKSLIKPEYGEMADYNVMPYYSKQTLEHYGLTEEELVCKEDVYRLSTNKLIDKIYKVELPLFVVTSLFLILYLRKKINPLHSNMLLVAILFVGCFYLLTLYSSWFMYRYLIPVFPLMVTVIVVTLYKTLNRSQEVT